MLRLNLNTNGSQNHSVPGAKERAASEGNHVGIVCSVPGDFFRHVVGRIARGMNVEGIS